MIATPPAPRAAWAARLNAATFLNPAKALGLLNSLGPARLAVAGDAEWAGSAAGVPLERAARWRREALSFDLDGELRRMEALGARLLTHGEPDYPALLASLADAPLALYAWGRLEDLPAAAVVGSRAPTAYGRRMARRLAGDLARRRVAVVSGLARGIDAEAHDAALEAGGTTWAVLDGLGRIYPPENRDLARRIAAEGGCVLSEQPLSAMPLREHFPRRNRIVAGLSWATLVVEGRANSGALLTAKNAAEYGREVLAVPGPADSPLSEAPHRLLRDGARLVASVEDVVAAFPPGFVSRPFAPRRAAAAPAIEGEEALILRHLGGDTLSLEELARITGLDTAHLSLIMFGLEIKELVSAVPGQRYAKKTI